MLDQFTERNNDCVVINLFGQLTQGNREGTCRKYSRIYSKRQIVQRKSNKKINKNIFISIVDEKGNRHIV